MPRAEARGGSASAKGYCSTGMATGDRGVPRRAPILRSSPTCGGWKAGLASAEFRLASPQMPRAEARGASLESMVNERFMIISEASAGLRQNTDEIGFEFYQQREKMQARKIAAQLHH